MSKGTPKHTWEAEVGNPSHLITTHHVTPKSIETRALKGFLDLMEFGATFNHELHNECGGIVQQIRDTHFPSLPLNQWREWRVTDRHSGLTQVVRLRRTS